MIIHVDNILFGVLLYCSCWVDVFSHNNQGYPPGVPPSTGVPQQMQYQQQPPQYQQQPPGNQQYQQQPPGNQQYQQPPSNQQYQQPPSNQQYQQPPSNQQYQQPAGNQQYQQPPSNQQYQQPPSNQQYQQPPSNQQYQQQPPQGSHGHGHGHGQGHNFKHESHDQAHIAEHLKDYAHKPVDQMTDEEMEFHYFKLHDYDDNNKLDGNEITSAITHFQREDQDANSAAARTMSDNEISDIVDMVLKEDDLNNDGYVEYSEFATAQRRAKANMAKNEDHK